MPSAPPNSTSGRLVVNDAQSARQGRSRLRCREGLEAFKEAPSTCGMPCTRIGHHLASPGAAELAEAWLAAVAHMGLIPLLPQQSADLLRYRPHALQAWAVRSALSTLAAWTFEPSGVSPLESSAPWWLACC